MPTNYRKQMDEIIEDIRAKGRRPKLLMHVCCAPCSSSCLVQVRDDFDITAFFYNPNITEQAEYEKRLNEEKRLIRELNDGYRCADQLLAAEEQEESPTKREDRCCQIAHKEEIRCVPKGSETGSRSKHVQALRQICIREGDYEPNLFLELAKGHEQDPEGGERCKRCFELRLRNTARVAAEQGFDFFTTSLTLSPLKNAALLNEIGEKAGAEAGVRFLPSDFKKKDGYLLSLKLSKEHDLYRQDYCGCIYSKAQRDKQKKENSNYSGQVEATCKSIYAF